MKNYHEHHADALTTDAAHAPEMAQGARLILVLGGARSGKSTFAEKLAANSRRSVAFIATATASDEEMQTRIALHQTTRPHTWQTLEEALDLPGAVQRAASLAEVLLLDCLTLWTSNWLLHQSDIDWDAPVVTDMRFEQEALTEVEKLLDVLQSLSTEHTLIVVSNEVGLGLVPNTALGRVYRDTLGRVNQRLALAAERVYLLVAGIAVDLKRLPAAPDLY